MNTDKDCGHAYFRIQHVYAEVTEYCLEEVILGTVFEKSALHCVCSNLKSQIDTVLQTGSKKKIQAVSKMSNQMFANMHNHTCSKMSIAFWYCSNCAA